MSNITNINNLNYIEDDDMVVLSSMRSGGTFEPETTKLWNTLCKQTNGLIVDVGAYTGIYAMLALKSTTDIPVVAYEPNPKTYKRMLCNIGLNFSDDEKIRLTTLNKAISDKCGISYFMTKTMLEMSSACKLTDRVTPEQVEISTLDREMKSLPVGLIKIDVEGHELMVLKGASYILDNYRPNLIIECLTTQEYNAVYKYLRNRYHYNVDPLPYDGRNFHFYRENKFTSN